MNTFVQYEPGRNQPSERGDYLVLLENYTGKRRFEVDTWYKGWLDWNDDRVKENGYRVLAWSELPPKNMQLEQVLAWPA